MIKKSCRPLAVLFALAAGSAVAAPVTYSLSFTNSSGMLNGSITTDGTVGAIGLSNITAWSFAQTGPAAFSISSAEAASGFQCIGTSGCFTATDTTLSFDFTSTVANDPFSNYQGSAGVVQFVEYAQGGSSPISASGYLSSSQEFYAPGSNVIGSASGSVPEPSALSLTVLALVGLGLVRGGKRTTRVA